MDSPWPKVIVVLGLALLSAVLAITGHILGAISFFVMLFLV